jgi:hypothetical protein
VTFIEERLASALGGRRHFFQGWVWYLGSCLSVGFEERNPLFAIVNLLFFFYWRAQEIRSLLLGDRVEEQIIVVKFDSWLYILIRVAAGLGIVGLHVFERGVRRFLIEGLFMKLTGEVNWFEFALLLNQWFHDPTAILNS